MQKIIVEDVNCSNVPWFIILKDGTKNKNNRKDIALGIIILKK